MKLSRVVPALLAVALAASAFADDANFVPMARPDGAPATVREAVQQLVAHVHATRTPTVKKAHAPGRIAPNVIEFETADTAFIIPAAGSVPGANGTFFKSDLALGNFSNVTQNIGVGWLVTGQNNANAPLSYFTVPANTIAQLNDFVGQTLKKSGLGALLVIAYDSAGTSPDDNAIIDGFSRIWTPQPGSAGTVSQSFPSVSIIDSTDNDPAFAIGLRQDANFRTNVGVVNLDTAAHTWTVTSLANNATTTMTVQPFSLGQTGVPASFASSTGALAVQFVPDATGILWSAYASSVDNITGDGWVSRATQ